MAENKPEAVHTFKLNECEKVEDHWNGFHMPCWICILDIDRDTMLWNAECKVYVHRDCLLKRMINQGI